MCIKNCVNWVFFVFLFIMCHLCPLIIDSRVCMMSCLCYFPCPRSRLITQNLKTNCQLEGFVYILFIVPHIGSFKKKKNLLNIRMSITTHKHLSFFTWTELLKTVWVPRYCGSGTQQPSRKQYYEQLWMLVTIALLFPMSAFLLSLSLLILFFLYKIPFSYICSLGTWLQLLSHKNHEILWGGRSYLKYSSRCS